MTHGSLQLLPLFFLDFAVGVLALELGLEFGAELIPVPGPPRCGVLAELRGRLWPLLPPPPPPM